MKKNALFLLSIGLIMSGNICANSSAPMSESTQKSSAKEPIKESLLARRAERIQRSKNFKKVMSVAEEAFKPTSPNNAEELKTQQQAGLFMELIESLWEELLAIDTELGTIRHDIAEIKQ